MIPPSSADLRPSASRPVLRHAAGMFNPLLLPTFRLPGAPAPGPSGLHRLTGPRSSATSARPRFSGATPHRRERCPRCGAHVSAVLMLEHALHTCPQSPIAHPRHDLVVTLSSGAPSAQHDK